MNPSELVAEVMKLEPHARAAIARQLLESLDDLSPSEADALWFEEAERRDREVDAGALPTVRAADVFRNLRAAVR